MSERESLASRIKKGVESGFFGEDEIPDCFGTHADYTYCCCNCPIEEDCQDELTRRLGGE